jgi:prevent-host-death family protein
MNTTTISKLKASLSEYLSKVKAGEDLVITERGRIIAKIIPVKRNGQDADQDLSRLERSGLARIGRNALPRNFWDLPRPGNSTQSAVKAILKDREEGR